MYSLASDINRDLEDVICTDTCNNVAQLSLWDYNCGGYALGKYNWYLPYWIDDEDGYVAHCSGKAYTSLLEEYREGFISESSGTTMTFAQCGQRHLLAIWKKTVCAAYMM